MPANKASTGTVVAPKKSKGSDIVFDANKAQQIMSSASGADSTDTPWSPAKKRQWIETFQRKGVNAKGKSTKLYIHLDGVDTVDIDTGEVIPRP